VLDGPVGANTPVKPPRAKRQRRFLVERKLKWFGRTWQQDGVVHDKLNNARNQPQNFLYDYRTRRIDIVL
jgi:CHASE1-domain containing sensor protein